MSSMEDSVNGGLEQFMLLAKTARGRACVALIQQVLSNKKIYVFGEIMQMANVQALRNTEHEQYLNLLEIFAYGKFVDYIENQAQLPELTKEQNSKLKKLTIIALSQKNKFVRFELLKKELAIIDQRELEDLIIDSIYSGIIRGKINQREERFEVTYSMGRDVRRDDIVAMISKLSSWCASANEVCTSIDSELGFAKDVYRKERNEQTATKEKVEKMLKHTNISDKDFISYNNLFGDSPRVSKSRK